MKRNIKISTVIVLLMAWSQARSQSVTLDSILTVVRQQNPMLKSFDRRADAMNIYAQGSRSWMAPEVGGGLWMLPYKKATDERDKGQIMLSVQQRFTNPGRLRANQVYMESKAAVETASGQVAFNELRSQAKLTYYQWVILEKKKNVLNENEEIMKLILEVARVRYPYNQGKLNNIYKAEGRLGEIINMIIMNDNQIAQKNILLDQLMNVSPNVRFSIDTTSQLPRIGYLFPDTSAIAQNRSDIRRIEKSIQVMKLNQALEGYQSKPDFNLSFNHMIARGSGMPNQFMLLGMVSIPIAPWSSKMYKSNVRGMDKEIEAMKAERNAILVESQGMASAMVSEINTLGKQIENYEKRIVPALRKNYESLMRSYEENKEDLPMVIDGWEALNMTQMQYLDTVGKYYEMIVNYEKQLEK